jgi:hypothetical protein
MVKLSFEELKKLGADLKQARKLLITARVKLGKSTSKNIPVLKLDEFLKK